MKTKIIFLLSILCAFAACNKEECETEGMTYNVEIRPIINTNCATSGCHSEGTTSTFPMNDYATTKFAVDFGKIVGAINHQEGFLPMPYPPGSEKLDDCSISQLEAWIADGAPE